MTAPSPRYTVKFIKSARDGVQALDGSIRKRLRKSIEKKLQANPADYGKPLSGKLTGYWSFAFAAHRIIYRIYEDRKLVVICAVGPRHSEHASDIYRVFESLVRAGTTARQIMETLNVPPKPRKTT